MKDEHTNGKKMARNGLNTVIYKGTFVSNHSLSKKDNYLIFYISVPLKTAQIIRPCFKSQIKGDLKSIKRNDYSDFHATISYYKCDHL